MFLIHSTIFFTGVDLHGSFQVAGKNKGTEFCGKKRVNVHGVRQNLFYGERDLRKKVLLRRLQNAVLFVIHNFQ